MYMKNFIYTHCGSEDFFCGITSCSPLKVSRRFGETCRFSLQGWGVSQARIACLMVGLLLCLLANLGAGGDIYLRNVSRLSSDYIALYPRRWDSSHFLQFYMQTIRCWFSNQKLKNRLEHTTEKNLQNILASEFQNQKQNQTRAVHVFGGRKLYVWVIIQLPRIL
jgi:hypothetical protein